MTSRLRLLAVVFIGALAALFFWAPWNNTNPLDEGKRIFLTVSEPNCAICHRLRDAGAAGEVGPDLDSLKPDQARVKAAVTNGIGAMPAFEALSSEQIDAVSLYVSTAAGRKK
ncbi:MAG TPA: cytochrome c [Alphaproteobacteria bacterium]|nr:cytochrome c [Alphaproteobacteria bacterium]